MRRSCIAITAVVLGSASILPVNAQEVPFGGAILSLFGISAPDAPKIDYRERAPLVVPPRSSLPTPQEQREARGRANWPNDPDLQRQRDANAEARMPATEREQYRLNQNPRLSNGELARGRGGSATRGPSVSSSDNDPYELLYGPMRQAREADAAFANKAKQAELPLGQEPPRRFLSEPPQGLRGATQRVAPTREVTGTRSDSTGQREFITGQPVPN